MIESGNCECVTSEVPFMIYQAFACQTSSRKLLLFHLCYQQPALSDNPVKAKKLQYNNGSSLP